MVTFRSRAATLSYDLRSPEEKVLMAPKVLVKGMALRGRAEALEVKLDTVKEGMGENRTILTVGVLQVAGVIAYFVANWLFAVTAGPREYGVVAYTTAQSTFLAGIVNLGLDHVLTKELAKNRLSPIVGAVFLLRVALLMIMIIVIAFLAFIQSADPQIRVCVLVFGLCNIFVTTDLHNYFDIDNRIPLHMAALFFQRVLFLMLVMALIWLKPSWVMAASYGILLLSTVMMSTLFQILIYGQEAWRTLRTADVYALKAFIRTY